MYLFRAEGVGLGEADILSSSEKAAKLAMARKMSRNAAMLNGFSKLILVLVHRPNDKSQVAVRIDTNQKDPFYYHSIWDEKPVIEKVHELEEEPDFED